jgi:hypothetical protein
MPSLGVSSLDLGPPHRGLFSFQGLGFGTGLPPRLETAVDRHYQPQLWLRGEAMFGQPGTGEAVKGAEAIVALRLPQ